MHPMPQSNAVDLKYPKSFLLGTSALVCLALAAPVMADDFTIASGSTTNDGYTINTGDTVTVTGALTTTGTDRGIEPSGVGTNTVIVSETGNITAGGDGINANDGNTVIINGNVTSTTEDGVDLRANNTITVGSSGSITAKDHGIEAENGNTVNIFGTVVAEDHGIDLGNDDSSTSGGNVVVINAGAVVRGDTAVKFDNGGNTLTVSGLLDGGFEAVGQNNEITISSSGSITTTGDYAYGIYNKGDTNTTTVSGSIETTGDDAYGIYNEGDTNTTTISGSITTTGDEGGIYNDGDTNTTTVSGSITTTGDEGGIYNDGDNNTTTSLAVLRRLVIMQVAFILWRQQHDHHLWQHYDDWYSADGIEYYGDRQHDHHLWHSKSRQVQSQPLCIAKSASGNSFTLNEGATIIGDILVESTRTHAATNSKLIFNLGASTSYAYSVSGQGEGTGAGQWTFSDLDGRTQGVTTTGTGCDTTMTTITVCNLVTGVSTGNLEAQDELQFSMNSSMIGSLEFGSGQADAPAEAMSFTQSSKSNTWTNVYGGTSKRASSTTKLAFDTSNRGLTIGTPVSINDTLDVDLVFNVSRTSLDIGLTKDQEITSNSYNLGAVLRDLAPSTGWAVDAFGFIGRNFYDGKRKVMNNQEATGSETVTAAYSGSEVLVGVDAQYSNPINDTLNFIGGVNASLSNEKIGAYSESKYYSWDARTMAQASGGITAGLEYHTDALTTFANLGVQGMSQRSGKTATYTNNGTAGSYTNNSRGDIYRTASVGFDYKAEDGLSFTGAIERFSSTGGVSGNSASLTANWSF